MSVFRKSTIRSDLYEQTYRASIYAIIGDKVPKTEIKGNRFANIDCWTANVFVNNLYNWCRKNPRRKPTRSLIQNLVTEANQYSPKERKIVMPSVPKKIPLRLALALTGGAYHEAWHSLYSCKRFLTYSEMLSIFEPYFSKIKNWGRAMTIVLDWSGIVEDIRIERLGTKQFPGSWTKMNDLTDFIIDQEVESYSGDSPNSANIMARTFREYGLGYSTKKTNAIINMYKEWDSFAYNFVTNGPLTSILKRAISLKEDEDLGYIKLSLEIAYAFEQIEESFVERKPVKGDSSDLNPSQDFLENYIENKNSRLMDFSYENAIESYVKTLREKEKKKERDNVAFYMPYNESLDRLRYIGPRDFDQVKFNLIEQQLTQAKNKASNIANILRRLFQKENRKKEKRVSKKGTRLNNKYLVKTSIESRAGLPPRKPFIKKKRDPEESIAAFILIDESASMKKDLWYSSSIVLLLSELISSLKGSVFISGFQDFTLHSRKKPKIYQGYQIKYETLHKIYKTFKDQNFTAIRNLSAIEADGSTPMCDGLQFAIETIKVRKEKHRFIFIVTDGKPTQNIEVIKSQIKKTEEMGIDLIAVGIGKRSQSIQAVFSQHIWARKKENLGEEIITSLGKVLQL